MSGEMRADAVYRKIGWRLIPFLMAGYISAFLDRSNIGFAKLQTAHDLGFSDAVFGLGAGLFYLGYSVFELPSNLLLRRIGARVTFARIMIVWGLVSTAFALMRTPTHFYILRLLLGCAEAGFFPGVLLYLSFWFPAARRARMTAVFMSAMALSGLIGGPLSGWVMSGADGASGWRGWQWMFVIEGLPAVVLGVATLLLLQDRPEQAPWLDDEERALLAADLAADDAGGPDTKVEHALGPALRDPRLYALAAMAAALTAGIGGIAFWLPSILKSAGVKGVLEIGLLSALPYLVAIVVQQWVARRSDFMQERRRHAAACVMIAGAAWIVMPLARASPAISLILLIAVAAGSFGATGPFWSLPPTYFKGTAAAAGIAIVTTFGGIAAFLAPIIVGWASARSGSLAVGQLLYGGLLIVASIWLLAGTKGSARRQPA